MSPDPLSIVWNVITWFLSRPVLRVRIREDEPTREICGLVFEVENVSDKVTSMSPAVTASYLTAKRQCRHIVFDVREGDRNLPPFTCKQFSASARESQPERCYGWFRTYNFVPIRGRACHIRIRNASMQPVGFWRFHIERLRFKLIGKVDVKTSMTIDEYRAQERSKGPH